MHQFNNFPNHSSQDNVLSKDHGPYPFVFNIAQATRQNRLFRRTLWTGNHMQLTLMAIPVGEEIGLEMHANLDQFIRVEEGWGLVKMGASKHILDFQTRIRNGYAFFIPAGTWHNLINIGRTPLKLYSIYAPPQHPNGTVHRTRQEALAQEHTY